MPAYCLLSLHLQPKHSDGAQARNVAFIVLECQKHSYVSHSNFPIFLLSMQIQNTHVRTLNAGLFVAKLPLLLQTNAMWLLAKSEAHQKRNGCKNTGKIATANFKEYAQSAKRLHQPQNITTIAQRANNLMQMNSEVTFSYYTPSIRRLAPDPPPIARRHIHFSAYPFII